MTIFLCLYPPSMVTVYLRLSIEEACIKAHTLTPHMCMVWVGLICSFTFQSEMVVLRCKVSLRHQYHYVPTNPTTNIPSTASPDASTSGLSLTVTTDHTPVTI